MGKSKKIYSYKKVKLPSVKNTLLVFLFLFLAIFGIIIFILGERIKNEKPPENLPTVMEIKIKAMVSGHPIEKMVPTIASQQSNVAAFLVAIAKKESNWGKNSPQKDGKECYNYWGYRGEYNQTDSGYSCFDSPEQAVSEVGGRIRELVMQKVDTPREMVYPWKCGWDCSGHSPESVSKWVRDVAYYYGKLKK